MKIVEIHWLDSIGLASWNDPDSLSDTSMIQRSIGWLVGETDDSYIVSATIGDGHEGVYAPLKIPKIAIVKFWEIQGLS